MPCVFVSNRARVRVCVYVCACVYVFTERAGQTRGKAAVHSLITKINRAAVDSGVSEVHSGMRSAPAGRVKMYVQRF